MIKKTLLTLLLLLPFALGAQQTVGSWKVYPSFDTVETIVESSNKVYYLSSTKTLYSYDKDTDETYIYGIDNKLTDTGITGIYYNSMAGYLAVAYSSANIDIIYDNGKVIQLSDISNAVMTQAKSIKDISFAPGKMLVTTNFGLVLYNDKKMIVEDSGIYSVSLDYAVITDDYLYAHVAESSGNKIAVIETGKKLNSFDNFTVLDPTVWCFGLYYLEGGKAIMLINGADAFATIKYDKDTNALVYDYIKVPKAVTCFAAKDGYIVEGTTAYAYVKLDGTSTVYDTPSQLQSSLISFWNNPKRLWAGSADGVGCYDVADDGSLTVLNDRYHPNAMTMGKVGRLYMSPSGKLYISYMGRAHCFADWTSNEFAKVNVIDNGVIRDITPTGIDNLVSSNANGYIYNMYDIVEDPNDPSIYYSCSLHEGILKFKDYQLVNRYTKKNSPLSETSTAAANYTMAVTLDPIGNLWCLAGYIKADTVGLFRILSADGLKKDGDTADSDWQSLVLSGYKGERDSHIFACQKSNTVLAMYYNLFGVACVDTKGTTSVDDDVVTLVQNFEDQDGKIFDIGFPGGFAEDKNGKVWVGHSSGVFEITDPSKMSQSNFTVRRLKVPRNDGTNFADYLLDSEFVTSIAVDNTNRKWLGTLDSGVYLVSEDGTQIIEHYTTDNSPLPSNRVYAVACDNNSNAVYFGTLNGLAQYNSSSAPAADDYSDVYAYPNPVRPDYTGWIVVKGLMDNSLVKIADAAGNVFFQGVSEGGMITWDGCDSRGQRVKTGVYYVFASQNANGSASGAVTKILVVK